MFNHRFIAGLVVGLLVAGTLLGGSAIAATTGKSLCVGKATGKVRVISNAKKCTNKETKVSIPDLAQGVAGPQGAQGLQGSQGLTGAKGETGPVGPKGADALAPTFSSSTCQQNWRFPMPGHVSVSGATRSLDGSGWAIYLGSPSQGRLIASASAHDGATYNWTWAGDVTESSVLYLDYTGGQAYTSGVSCILEGTYSTIHWTL
jgi:hypothetical protein